MATALTTDASVLTEVANDFAYEGVFAGQFEALGRPGDLVLGISTSGAAISITIMHALSELVERTHGRLRARCSSPGQERSSHEPRGSSGERPGRDRV